MGPFNIPSDLRRNIELFVSQSEKITNDSSSKQISQLKTILDSLWKSREFHELASYSHLDSQAISHLGKELSDLEAKEKGSGSNLSSLLEWNEKTRAVFKEFLLSKLPLANKEVLDKLLISIRVHDHEEIRRIIGSYKVDLTYFLKSSLFESADDETISILIQAGADIRSPSVAHTFLLEASRRSQEEMEHLFKLFAAHGLNLNQRTTVGYAFDASYTWALEHRLSMDGMPPLQRVIDQWGLIPNPEPEGQESPYLSGLLKIGYEDDVRVLLFNGANVSPLTAKQLESDPLYNEMWRVRQEALATLQREMGAKMVEKLKESAGIKESPPELIRLAGSYSPETLTTISNIPVLRQRLLQLCLSIELRHRMERAKALASAVALATFFPDWRGHGS